MKNPLLDKEFLKELDQYNHKEIYAKIIALNFNEFPIEAIEGRVTGGSINIDGTSAIRRTCNLTLVAKELNINNFYWGLTNKFKLEIGVRNFINPNYPEIIWFKQGVYIITAFNTSFSTNNYNISISGQDKMCLLNGSVGGALPSSIDFGAIEDTIYSYEKVNFENKNLYVANRFYILNPNYNPSNGQNQYIISNDEYKDTETYYNKKAEKFITDLPLKTIIREAIHTYAHEPYHNIIINDLDDYGLKLLEYRGDKPFYFFFDGSICDQMTYDGTVQCYYISEDGKETKTTIDSLPSNYYNNLINIFEENVKTIRLEGSDKLYSIAKIEYGQTAGYSLTELTYTGELISNVGETLTSILDKIKQMLGEFEYFYDVEGHFVFQAKKIYINTSWNTIVKTNDGDAYAENAAYTSAISYSFEDTNLITSFSNNPQLNNLKNDFSVWGEKKNIKDEPVSIHARYAIDTKPTYYYSITENKAFISDELSSIYPQEEYTEWREILYQMAVDFFKHNQEDDFLIQVKENNKVDGEYIYPNGYTGYEQYYTDIQGFWRQLYEPAPIVIRKSVGGKYEDVEQKVDEEEGTFEIVNKWAEYKEDQDDFICDYYLPTDWKEKYPCLPENEIKHFSDDYAFWNKSVITAPETLNFWIDFLDNAGELNSYSVKAVGDRAKAVNDSKVTAIYFRETPNIIFYSPEEYNPFEIKTGYGYIQLPNYLKNVFSISSQGKSAKDLIDEMLYNYTYCIQSVTINAIPIYYLEPNTKIYIHDEESKINGDYIVSKLTIPLTYNGTMSITATKSAERLY